MELSNKIAEKYDIQTDSDEHVCEACGAILEDVGTKIYMHEYVTEYRSFPDDDFIDSTTTDSETDSEYMCAECGTTLSQENLDVMF